MSNDMNKTVREFYKAVEGVKNKKTGGYDTQATVRRIEDGVAWVHIPDGVDETPARLTISAKVGDVVQVRIVNGRAFLVGNASAPPTDNTEAVKAMGQAGLAAEAASIARQKADEAVEDAATAHEAAMLAKDSADAAQASADAAQTSADNAQTSATTANTAANNALIGLGTVESVIDVVNWFAEHKTLSTDTTVDPNKTYYSYDASTGTLTKLDPEGTEDPSALGWYEMTDAVADYVATHVATTNDGLYVVAQTNGWRVLISSGGGNYPAGVFMINPSGNIVTQFGTETSIKTTNGTELAHFGYAEGQAETGTDVAPYSFFGRLLSVDSQLYLDDYYTTMTYVVGDFVRYNDTMYVCTTNTPSPAGAWNSTYWREASPGNYSFAAGDSCYALGWASTAEGSGRASGNTSHAEGETTRAAGGSSHAEGVRTYAQGNYAHAEGDTTRANGTGAHSEGYATFASGDYAHAEGSETFADGDHSHSQNLGTQAGFEAQTAIGKYNSNTSAHVFEIGNGTSDSNRSNAMTVDWNGNIWSNNLSLKQLTMTRTSNSLVDATSFARMTAYTRSDILFLNGNLYITFSGNTGFTEIGRIAGWSAAYDVLVDVPAQDNGAKVALVQISTSGVISVFTNTGVASGFFRFNTSVPCS